MRIKDYELIVQGEQAPPDAVQLVRGPAEERDVSARGSGLGTELFHVGPGRGPCPQHRSQSALHRLLRAVIIVFPGNTIMRPSVDARAQQQPTTLSGPINQPS